MLCILPASVNVIGKALRYASMSIELYTSVLPSVFVFACCVTLTVTAGTPVPVTVTVADLGLVPVFAEDAVTVIVALFDPLTGDTVSQLPSSVILQEVLEEMLNVPFDPEA
jgi:voltage-gated potassium channel Kch